MLAPILPLALLVRHFRLQLDKGAPVGRFVTVSPIVLLLLTAWSLGEVLGYSTARP